MFDNCDGGGSLETTKVDRAAQIRMTTARYAHEHSQKPKHGRHFDHAGLKICSQHIEIEDNNATTQHNQRKRTANSLNERTTYMDQHMNNHTNKHTTNSLETNKCTDMTNIQNLCASFLPLEAKSTRPDLVGRRI